MSLKDQLREILKDVLPTSPEDAVFGTDLIETVTPLLTRPYASASILQTFSALAADSTSPIARIEQGFGYYRRPEAQVQRAQLGPSAEPQTPQSPSTPPPIRSRDTQLEEKFRAFFMRQSRYQSRFPVHIEHTSANQQPSGVNKWKFPDVVELDWEDVGEVGDDGFVLDKALLEVKRSLGEQPFRLSSIELKVELTLGSFREHFFQCVSNSMWSHSARLVVASSISDALLAEELRRLGTSYGVQIQSFDMSMDKLEAMPGATDILALSNAQFEKLRGAVSPNIVSAGRSRTILDWDHIRDMMKQIEVFGDIFRWIARCLHDGKPYAYAKYIDLLSVEDKLQDIGDNPGHEL